MSVLDRESVEVSQGELEPEDAGTQTAEEIADWEKVKNDDFRKECLDLETGFMSCAMENAYMDAFIEDEKKKDESFLETIGHQVSVFISKEV